jgi:hypothetical protein
MVTSRWLLGAPWRALGADPIVALTDVLAAWGVDDPSAPNLLGGVTGAQRVFFALEVDGDRTEHRLYMEQEAGLSLPAWVQGDGRPVVQVAFRWASDEPAARTTTYVRPTATDRAALESVVRSAVAGLEPRTAADVVELWSHVPAESSERASAVLQASERGTHRRSVDLSLLGADLHVRDARSLVARLAPDAAPGWLDRVGADRLGRVGAGVDRTGRGYVTLYHDRWIADDRTSAGRTAG